MSRYTKRYTVECPRCDGGTVAVVVTGDTGRYHGPPEHCYPAEEDSNISPCSHCWADDYSEAEWQAMELAKSSWDDDGDYESDDYIPEYGDSPL